MKIDIGRSTVASILAEAGFEPAPERGRKRTWNQFLRSHWQTLYACDFFSVETLRVFGTVRVMVLFVIELRSRVVHIAGVRIDPDSTWMMQVARNLLDPDSGFLRDATHLIHDRDPVFTKAWTKLLKSGRVKCVRIPASSPNCNATCERLLESVRRECVDHVIVLGESHLQSVLTEYVALFQRSSAAPRHRATVSSSTRRGSLCPDRINRRVSRAWGPPEVQ